MFRERADLHLLGRVQSRLAAIAAQRAEQGGGPPVRSQRHDEAIEAIILGVARPDGFERFLEARIEPLLAGEAFDGEVVYVDDAVRHILVRGDADGMTDLGPHAQAHAFKHRHDLR